jgi:hypothetical protein
MIITGTSRASRVRAWLIWTAGFPAFPLAGLAGTAVAGRVDPAQGVRHGAGSLGDHGGVPDVGLGRAAVQIGDPAHRQPGQVGDLTAGRQGDRDRQRADGGRLIDRDQQPFVGLQRGEELAQPSLVLGQRGVVQPLAGRVQGHRMVGALAHVQPA